MQIDLQAQKKSLFYKSFFAVYVVLMAYNCHRYIFMYNSTRTSPTYQDTPMVWKAGKYVLLLIILAIAYFFAKKYKSQRLNLVLPIFSFIGWLFFVNVVWVITYGQILFDELEYFIWALTLSPILFLADDIKVLVANFIPDNFVWIASFIVLSDFYVIINYYLTGRLTALSYENSLLRFGGLWDDPNGFGLFSVYLSYIALNKRRWIYFILLSVCIFYTLSFSSYFLWFVVIFLWGTKNFKVKNRLVIFVGIAISLGITFLLLYGDMIINSVNVALKRKSGSMSEHSEINFDYTFFPYLERKFIFHETWYINFFYNYSPFSILFLILIAFFLFNIIFTKSKKYTQVFILLFLLDCFFLPMFIVFPINVCFFIILYSSLGINSPTLYQNSLQ